MWAKGVSLHFIVDNGNQKNLNLADFFYKLKFLTTTHPQPYKIGWLDHCLNVHVSQQCCLPYAIKPLKDEVIYDISPLEFSDVILGQPYMSKIHIVYESQPHSVFITLGKWLYRIPKVAPKDSISLILAKMWRKVITHMGKFVLFVVYSKWKEDYGHIYNLCIESHYIAKEDGQSHGRIQGHLHLTYKGTSTLPSQAFNWPGS